MGKDVQDLAKLSLKLAFSLLVIAGVGYAAAKGWNYANRDKV
jgi:hypothetical protein